LFLIYPFSPHPLRSPLLLLAAEPYQALDRSFVSLSLRSPPPKDTQKENHDKLNVNPPCITTSLSLGGGVHRRQLVLQNRQEPTKPCSPSRLRFPPPPSSNISSSSSHPTNGQSQSLSALPDAPKLTPSKLFSLPELIKGTSPKPLQHNSSFLNLGDSDDELSHQPLILSGAVDIDDDSADEYSQHVPPVLHSQFVPTSRSPPFPDESKIRPKLSVSFSTLPSISIVDTSSNNSSNNPPPLSPHLAIPSGSTFTPHSRLSSLETHPDWFDFDYDHLKPSKTAVLPRHAKRNFISNNLTNDDPDRNPPNAPASKRRKPGDDLASPSGCGDIDTPTTERKKKTQKSTKRVQRAKTATIFAPKPFSGDFTLFASGSQTYRPNYDDATSEIRAMISNPDILKRTSPDRDPPARRLFRHPSRHEGVGTSRCRSFIHHPNAVGHSNSANSLEIVVSRPLEDGEIDVTVHPPKPLLSHSMQTPDTISYSQSILPFNRGECASITVETVCSLLRGQYRSLYDRLILVDCRYDYEYSGGHIKNAINLQDFNLNDHFFKHYRNVRNIVIFYCEFSSQRGPSCYKMMRDLDRKYNTYPDLYYPDIYLLSKGYSNFFAQTNVS
jgi:hypothetical protein